MVRIRYKRDNYLLTNNSIVGTKTVYTVALNLELMTYTIIDNMTNKVETNGNAKTLNGLKKAAKNALVNLGVVFQDEVRTRIDVNNKEYSVA